MDTLTALLPFSQLSFLHLLYKTGTTTASFTGSFSHTTIFCHPKLIKDTYDKNCEKKMESPTSPQRKTSLHQGLLIDHIKPNCQMFEKHVLGTTATTLKQYAFPTQVQKKPAMSFLPRSWDWKVLYLPDSSRAFPQLIPYPVPCSASQGTYSRPKATALPSQAKRSGLAKPTASHFPNNPPQETINKDGSAPDKKNHPRRNRACRGYTWSTRRWLPCSRSPAAAPRSRRLLPHQGHGGDSGYGSPPAASHQTVGEDESRRGQARSPPRLRGRACDRGVPRPSRAVSLPKGLLRASPGA